MMPIVRTASGFGFNPKPVLRWLHRWLGLLAGLVLAVVGTTGALMSFQEDLLRWMNPGVMQVTAHEGQSPLPLPELVARIQAQKPTPAIATLRYSTAASPQGVMDSAWVGFRAKGKPVGEFVNPYTGALLGKARGEAFFHTVEDLHRRLLAGSTGKAITGASALIFFTILLSGAILRIRRAGLKYWFVPSHRGSWASRIYSWHAVLGIWLLVPFLLVTLTGLYWSYDWSRTLWHQATGTPQGKPAPHKMAEASHDAPNLSQIAARLAALSATRVQIFLPAKPDEAVRVNWQDAASPHARAFNTLQLQPGNAAILVDQPFAGLTFGTQIIRSMFALHSGEYFGRAGVWILFFASLSLPLFFISGLWLYVRRQRRAKPLAQPDAASSSTNLVLVVYASQTGTAQNMAQMTAQRLAAAGQDVLFRALDELGFDELSRASTALFVVSTYGDGEAPDHAKGLIETTWRKLPALPALRFAVLALGDRDYPHFCGFGIALRGQLLASGAMEQYPLLQADQADPAVFNEWMARLSESFGSTPAEAPTPLIGWTLSRRQQLNPAGIGDPTFELELTPNGTISADWQAGAIIDIVPEHTPVRVAHWLSATGVDGEQRVLHEGKPHPLAEALRHYELPPADQFPHHVPLQTAFDGLRRLGARSYSVASLPTAGCVRLLVRQVKVPPTPSDTGGFGIGSGWLTEYAPIGQKLNAVLRQNPNFLPMLDPDVPCLFIANGTGIAGIRAHIEARMAAGAKRNWVILGERSSQDAYWLAQWRLWAAQGMIDRIDWVFSRSPTSGSIRYVQHQLGAEHVALKNYLDEDAVVFICGSATGMAPAVEGVLSSLLGTQGWQSFRKAGRYRRDVY